ncbi:hypothetical protein M446_5357 [Methylobacterium sp. 4-46]|uniref:hypothetical protein n=1 Tax=unclassified Methylobacterium TaxID=2615210 RepID=UPI000152D193|nr:MULTISPECIES: hypothetical protein [Methylobacterium]ACA19675.1 hypothetical protein M446_5357 [Methylobacterium sp. 4-46]WFT78872.1 hypothetical protein QA634_26960 [Methylobacterium nodulans]
MASALSPVARRFGQRRPAQDPAPWPGVDPATALRPAALAGMEQERRAAPVALGSAGPVRTAGRRFVPWPPALVRAAEIGGLLLVLAAGIYGPPLVECRMMKRQGLFYADMTVRACLRERVAERYSRAEDRFTQIIRGL